METGDLSIVNGTQNKNSGLAKYDINKYLKYMALVRAKQIHRPNFPVFQDIILGKNIPLQVAQRATWK